MTHFVLKVELRPEEMLLLDGRVRPEVQRAVDLARDGERVRVQYGLSERHGHLVANARAVAGEKGEMRLSGAPISHCWLCDRDAGYGGKRKDKPLSMDGFDLDRGFISVRGHVSLGGCWQCLTALKPALQAELASVRAEVSDTLRTPEATQWKKWSLCTCAACGWTGHDGELGKLRTLFNDGWYPGKCPSCGAENRPLGKNLIEHKPDGFVVVPVPPARSAPAAQGAPLGQGGAVPQGEKP